MAEFNLPQSGTLEFVSGSSHPDANAIAGFIAANMPLAATAEPNARTELRNQIVSNLFGTEDELAEKNVTSTGVLVLRGRDIGQDHNDIVATLGYGVQASWTGVNVEDVTVVKSSGWAVDSRYRGRGLGAWMQTRLVAELQALATATQRPVIRVADFSDLKHAGDVNAIASETGWVRLVDPIIDSAKNALTEIAAADETILNTEKRRFTGADKLGTLGQIALELDQETIQVDDSLAIVERAASIGVPLRTICIPDTEIPYVVQHQNSSKLDKFIRKIQGRRIASEKIYRTFQILWPEYSSYE